MSSIVVSGDTSGAVTLTAPAVAGTVTVTLPAASGTMASLASVTANGVAYVNSSSQPTSGSALVFDGTNLGLGVTPSAWGGALSAGMDFKFSGGIASHNSANAFYLVANGYYNSSGVWKYRQNGYANYINVGNGDGSIAFYTAASGTAGNSITFIQAMTLDASSNLLVGTTTAYGAIASTGSIAPAATPSTSWGIDFASSTTPPNYVSFSSAATYDLAAGSGIVVVHNNTNGDAAVFITYGGNTVKLGGAASVVAGTGGANEIGLVYNGGVGKYRINNGYGTTQFLYITTIRTRTAS